jgi:hypothetical protein
VISSSASSATSGQQIVTADVANLPVPVSLDHEIFRLRDEVEAAEGPGVTFYGIVGHSIKPIVWPL